MEEIASLGLVVFLEGIFIYLFIFNKLNLLARRIPDEFLLLV